MPWLADGTGLAEADRIRGVRYLREDTPILWPHFSAENQRELIAVVDAVLVRTSQEDVRSGLEGYRRELTSKVPK